MVSGKIHVPVDHQQHCHPPQLFHLQLCLHQPWPPVCYQVPPDVQRQSQSQEGKDGDSSLLGSVSLPCSSHVDEWLQNWQEWRLGLCMRFSLRQCTTVCIVLISELTHYISYLACLGLGFFIPLIHHPDHPDTGEIYICIYRYSTMTSSGYNLLFSLYII